MSGDRIALRLRALAEGAERCVGLGPQIARLAARYAETLRGGGTLFFAGNGGSAAQAQHLAAEYVVRYQNARSALPALALGADVAQLTATGNDLGFEQIFGRQVAALCHPADLLILFSTSGRSPNLLVAAQAARAKGVPTVAWLGQQGGPLQDFVDEAVLVPAAEASQVQELQLALGHIIVELVEAELGVK